MNSQLGIQQFEFPEVDLTNFSPAPVPQHIRLGHQMEYVCKQLLDYCQHYEVLVHNLPIREGKQTLGEIDFILREKATEQIVHVELTYKFYIINPDIQEPIHQLIGPNKRDTFFTKMVKIRDKQFTLLHSKVGSKALVDIGIDSSKIVHQTCYKAQLFEPYGSQTSTIHPLNPNCIVGYWLRLADLHSDSFSSYQFYIPPKSQWVIQPYKTIEWTSYNTILPEIELRHFNQSSPMVWMRKNDTEYEKFFVVWW
ncbi:DUF1853 family protein [Maribacter sp. ACAM166]|uniref:DUF1853 family protein n=1 Tax=Maribacter sp. ACAM166 TaxID=2508996 RepID=UPI0010FF3048|nr:DUF1853 family protein [Maribacter sp. ACAM166]TLP79685.1 DUF1853 family protein [Maribacter sp. ACAM166]